MQELNQHKAQNKFFDDLRDKLEVFCLTLIFIIATSSITGNVEWLG